MTGTPEDRDWHAYPPGAVPQDAPVPAYGGPPGYGPVPAYGPPPGYGQVPAYGPPPGYGQVPGYGPAYGPPPGYGWYPLPPPAWPDGPGRPNLATTASVLGFVTAGLTFFASLISLVAAVDDGDEVALILGLGLPCAAGLIAGGVRLHDRRSPALLFGSAVGCVAVLLLGWLVGALTIHRTDGLQGLTTFVLLAMILPALTAAFSWTRNVREWAAARPD